MFGSLFNLASDVVKIATAPIEIAVDTTRIVTKPLADAVQEVVKDIKEETKEK